LAWKSEYRLIIYRLTPQTSLSRHLGLHSHICSPWQYFSSPPTSTNP